MPNHVQNIIRPVHRADFATLKKILLKEEDGKLVTNFKGVIPMPKGLENTTAGWGGDFVKQNEENKKKYGWANWYDFAVTKWGTKWDGMDAYVENGCISFETAWSAPMGVLEEIAKKFPIVVAYADEDIGGGNEGVFILSEDNAVNVFPNVNGRQLGNAIWGYMYEGEEWQKPAHFSREVADRLNDFLFPNEASNDPIFN